MMKLRRSVVGLLCLLFVGLGVRSLLETRDESAVEPAQQEAPLSEPEAATGEQPLALPEPASVGREAAEEAIEVEVAGSVAATKGGEAETLFGELIIDLVEPGGAPNTEEWLTVVPVDVTDGPAELGTGSLRGLAGSAGTRTSNQIELDRVFDVHVVRNLSRPHGPFRVVGPTSVEEPARATIEVPPALVRVRLRLVDEEGQPASGLKVRETVEWRPHSTFMGPKTVSASGEIILVLDEEAKSSDDAYGLMTAHWTEQTFTQRRWQIAFDPPLGAGNHDLGDVRPWEPPLLAVGRVVDEAGSGVEGVRVTVEASPAVSGLVLPYSVVRMDPTDADGRFEVRGSLGVLPLTLSAFGKRQRSDVAIVSEARGPELILELRALGMTRVLPPEGQGLPTLHWTVPGAELSAGRAYATRLSGVGGGGQVFGMPEGRYDCHVLRPGGVAPVVVRDVEFRAGEPFEDPRLNPLPEF